MYWAVLVQNLPIQQERQLPRHFCLLTINLVFVQDDIIWHDSHFLSRLLKLFFAGIKLLHRGVSAVFLRLARYFLFRENYMRMYVLTTSREKNN